MPRIQVLDPKTASQIAAGEVKWESTGLDRPSVVDVREQHRTEQAFQVADGVLSEGD